MTGERVVTVGEVERCWESIGDPGDPPLLLIMGPKTRRRRSSAACAMPRPSRATPARAPTVVRHGTADRMCHPSGGEATAAAIPGARLVLVEGLGRDLPPGAWPQITGAIAENARRAACARPV